jgi:hypothetical protein
VVGNLGQSFVSPNSVADGAVPVLDDTLIVAAGSNSLDMNQLMISNSLVHVLDV